MVKKKKAAKKLATATFGGGCFWGVEESFRQLKGVVATAVGYMGGSLPNPTYEDVCTDLTGHAEVVQVTFDSTVITYRQLLAHFWQVHDPVQINRQGPDVGTQYRSVVFCHTKEQERLATAARDRLAASGLRVATQIVPASAFYRAEEYHQRYLQKRGANVCH